MNFRVVYFLLAHVHRLFNATTSLNTFSACSQARPDQLGGKPVVQTHHGTARNFGAKVWRLIDETTKRLKIWRESLVLGETTKRLEVLARKSGAKWT